MIDGGEPPPFLAAPPVVPPRQRPAEALHALAAQLRERRVIGLYGAACHRFGVLSLPDVSVWTNGRVLWWRATGGETTWPAADPAGAAQRLAELVRARPGETGFRR
ncbi:MAG TPA: hypothetical protein VKV33_01640 [Streptosporangiaceae bacterium]|nr:hypothetical protein [Streptosporangiaceae bacterium]